MKRWLKVLITVLVILLVLGIVAWFVLLRPEAPVTVDSLNIDEATVTRGNIEVKVHGTGALEVATVRDVYSRTTGRVVEIHKEDGDAVEEGELIALLENETLETQLRSQSDELYLKDLEISSSRGDRVDTTLRAPVAGRVKQLHGDKGDDLSTLQGQYGALLVLSTDGRMRVTLPPLEGEPLLTPLDVKVRIGDQVENGTLLSADENGLQVQIQNDSYEVGAAARVTTEGGQELGEGVLEINKPLAVTGVSGQIRTVDVEENDKVKANARLMTLEDDAVSLSTETAIIQRDTLERNLADTRQRIGWLEIRAPISGIIGNLTLKEDATLTEGALIGTIIQTDVAKIRLAVDELDIASVLPGQPALIKMDALPGKSYPAEVERVLPLGTREGGVTTYDVLLYMDAQDNMLPLMSVSGDITVASAEGVLLVPVASLITVGDDRYVTLMPTDADLAGYGTSRTPSSRMSSLMGRGSNDATTLQTIAPQLMRRVELGLFNGEYAQVVTGLSEGEKVVVPRSGSNLFATMMSMGGGASQ